MSDVIPKAASVRGIEISDVRYDSDGYQVPAYLARPKKAGRHPGVVVGQEAFGITDHVRDIAAALAGEGYVAIVPDYYARTGEPKPRTDIPAILSAIDRIHNPTILRDYQNAIAYLVTVGMCDPKRIGTMGFCTGGTYSMLLAIERRDLACACLWYVSQLTYQQLNERKPYHPIDRAGEIRCPALFIYGTADQVWTKEKTARLEANLKNGKSPATLRAYEGAGHAFLAPDGFAYHDEASKKAWPEALAFMRKHLRGPLSS